MLLDLSLTLSVDNPIFGKLPPGVADVVAAGHVGTHLDTLLQRPIPLDWMDRSGRLIDVRRFGSDVGMEALAGEDIVAGDFVIFRTAHIERHAYGEDAYFADHPQLDRAVIEALVEKGVSLIGIDAPAVRRGREEHGWADRFCEEHDAYVIENLNRLEMLDRARFAVRLAWFGHRGMSGLPVKVVAVLA